MVELINSKKRSDKINRFYVSILVFLVLVCIVVGIITIRRRNDGIKDDPVWNTTTETTSSTETLYTETSKPAAIEATEINVNGDPGLVDQGTLRKQSYDESYTLFDIQ